MSDSIIITLIICITIVTSLGLLAYLGKDEK